MGNIGRLVCVALPFALTIASLVALLIGGLGGVADKNMYMFSVNTANLTISENTLASLINGRSLVARQTPEEIAKAELEKAKAAFGQAGNAIGDAGKAAGNAVGAGVNGATDATKEKAKELLDKAKGEAGGIVGPNGFNLTAAQLGLANSYDISLWGFCYRENPGSDRICSNPTLDWATKEFNGTAKNLNAIGTLENIKIGMPTEVQKGLDAFAALTKWTQIVLIIAYVLLGIELLLGLFTSCSRVMSCLTWVVAGLAATAVCAAAAMATAMSAAVVGAIEGSQKVYGMRAGFNTRFLVAMWIAAALAIGAAMFWVFTICCCAPEKRPHRRAGGGGGGHSEKGGSYKGPYAPLHDPENDGGAYNRNSHQMSQYGAGPRQTSGRSDLAYEPYSNQVAR